MFVGDLVIMAGYSPPEDTVQKWTQEEKLEHVRRRAREVIEENGKWIENFDVKEARTIMETVCIMMLGKNV